MNKCLGFSPAARWVLLLAVTAAAAMSTSKAHAEDKAKKDETSEVGMGLAPGSPQVGTLPGGIQPSYGQRSEDESDYRFDYHGMLIMPLRVGLNKRTGDVADNQSKNVIHAPPVVPDYQDSFNYTSVTPQPYAQLAFSYGNNIVTGTAVIVARTASTATSFFQPPLQSGITDAFVTFNLPNLGKNAHIEANVGAFSNAYGAMGEYDLGRYGTPLIGRIVALGMGTPAAWFPGKRVGVGRLGGHCNECTPCRQGLFQVCRNQHYVGSTCDGGYAEMMLARSTGLVSIPEEMNSVEAAPILCAGIATFNAMRKSGALAGDLVAVQGIGGLGHLALQYARKMGFKVAAVGRGADIAEDAKRLGAHVYIDTNEDDAVERLLGMGGAQLILSTITDSAAASWNWNDSKA